MAKTQLKYISSSAWTKIQEICGLSFPPCFFDKWSISPHVPEEKNAGNFHDTQQYNEEAISTTDEGGFVLVHGPDDNESKHEKEEACTAPAPPKRRKVHHHSASSDHPPATTPSTPTRPAVTSMPPPAPPPRRSQSRREKRATRAPTSSEIDWLEATFESQALLNALRDERPITAAQREATILSAISQRKDELRTIEDDIRDLIRLYDGTERIFIKQEKQARRAQKEQEEDLDLDGPSSANWYALAHARVGAQVRNDVRKQFEKSLSSMWKKRMSFMKKRVAKVRSIELWERRLRVVRGESRVVELKDEVMDLVATIVEPSLDAEGREMNWLDLLD